MTSHVFWRTGIGVLLLVGLLAVAPEGAGPTRYTVIDLGTLGGARSHALGLNNAGQVVGTSTVAGGATHGFVYDHGSLLDLGTFGGKESTAYAISDAGTIAGRAQDQTGAFRAFVAPVHGGLADVSTLGRAPGAPFSTATGINARGDVVGYRQTANDHMAARTRGFLYGDSTLVDLGTFGGEDAVLTAVNDLGHFVGFYSLDPEADYSSHRAFHLQQGGIAQELGSLGGRITTPTAINNKGVIVGFGQLANGEYQAFVYGAGRLTALPTLRGGRQSFAWGVNEPGDIVGSSEAANGSLHAVLYQAGAIVDLNSLVPAGSGWLLTEARDINNSGAIVGAGVIGGAMHAFMLVPAL
jgi:probable HAF family extracellular repeat protein